MTTQPLQGQHTADNTLLTARPVQWQQTADNTLLTTRPVRRQQTPDNSRQQQQQQQQQQVPQVQQASSPFCAAKQWQPVLRRSTPTSADSLARVNGDRSKIACNKLVS